VTFVRSEKIALALLCGVLVIISAILLKLCWEYAITYDGLKGHASEERLQTVNRSAYAAFGLSLLAQVSTGAIFVLFDRRSTRRGRIIHFVVIVITTFACSNAVAFLLVKFNYR
jgi:hypothetical protein